MFEYNRFWHFWHTLDNRQYLKSFAAALAASIAFYAIGAIFFPPLLAILPISIPVIAAPVLLVIATIGFFTLISNFIYSRQNQHLEHLKHNTDDPLLQEHIDLYLNRRVICPRELLEGKPLAFPQIERSFKGPTSIKKPLMMLSEEVLQVKEEDALLNRNKRFKATGASKELFIKKTAASDGLFEVAAREMAEIVGFDGLIPNNAVTKAEQLEDTGKLREQVPSSYLLPSRQRISAVIEEENRERSEAKQIKNTSGVQNAVAKFVANLKTASYVNKAKEKNISKLLYLQEFVPGAENGDVLRTEVFFEADPGQATPQEKIPALRKKLLAIDQTSFQENFVLHIILGSQDANQGNFLFITNDKNKQILWSIDNERIMPEDNYNVTKPMPMMNGSVSVITKDTVMPEKMIENVFPIRLWLAGLPQAEVPFSKEVIKKVLDSLDTERLLAYHRQKKLFSSAAVGAQLDRVQLIRSLFEEESKKSRVTLTPKALFLKLVNNHPSYGFLKDEMGLTDFTVFSLLGQIPADADLSLFRHPLQAFPMYAKAAEAVSNELKGEPKQFSEESFESPYAARFIMFAMAAGQKNLEQRCPKGLDVLDEVTTTLTH